MYKRILVLEVTLAVLVLTMTVPGWAAPLRQARSVITYPTDGMTVSGSVDVTGVATHPNMNFYQLRFAAGPQPAGDSQWVDFAIVEGTQVENDVLATWDTTAIPDGVYTLALAVWGTDDASSPYLFFVTNLTVNNTQPVDTPTPEQAEEPTATLEPAPTAVIGATPTPVLVEQPPTATSQPSPTPGGEESEETAVVSPEDEDDGGFSLSVDASALRDAFYKGGRITLALFLLWGIYVFVKAGIRWLLRQNIPWPWPWW